MSHNLNNMPAILFVFSIGVLLMGVFTTNSPALAGKGKSGISTQNNIHAKKTLPEQISVSGVTVTDGGNNAFHEQGGPPASVEEVYLSIETDGDSHQVVVTKLELVNRHCRADDTDQGKRLKPIELHFEPESGERVESKDASPVTVSGSGRLYATFVAHEVYQVCDEFAFQATLEIDGRKRTLEVPLYVTLQSPIPHIDR